jgi:hypothetical protein
MGYSQSYQQEDIISNPFISNVLQKLKNHKIGVINIIIRPCKILINNNLIVMA